MCTEWSACWEDPEDARLRYVTPDSTLLIYNSYATVAEEGEELARHYASVNGMDLGENEEMLCPVDCGLNGIETPYLEFDAQSSSNGLMAIKEQILTHLFDHNLIGKVRCLLTFRGVPLWWNCGSWGNAYGRGSVDWDLVHLCEDIEYIDDECKILWGVWHPNAYAIYCNAGAPYDVTAVRPKRFTSDWQHDHGCLFVVGRIDGPSVEDCKQLIESAQAHMPEEPKAFIDRDQHMYDWPEGLYRPGEYMLDSACDLLEGMGMDVELDTYTARMEEFSEASFYAGWYSNYDYNQNVNRGFLPGSIAIEIHSGACEWISAYEGDYGRYCPFFVHAGVAATYGPVAEPTLEKMTKVDIFVAMLKAGYTVGEAFMAATPPAEEGASDERKYVKMALIGDPCYRPFPAKALVMKSS